MGVTAPHKIYVFHYVFSMKFMNFVKIASKISYRDFSGIFLYKSTLGPKELNSAWSISIEKSQRNLCS